MTQNDRQGSEAQQYVDKIGQQFWVCPECQMHSRIRRRDCWKCDYVLPSKLEPIHDPGIRAKGES